MTQGHPAAAIQHPSEARLEWLRAVFFLLLLAPLLALVFLAPLSQPAAYHVFADARSFLGVDHFWNVASNLPFLVVGLLGMRELRRRQWRVPAGWMAVFAGTSLVAFGSGIYHLAPADATLVWDRVPIGIAFMGFLAALVSDYVSPRAGRLLLLPGVGFALAAVAWWRATGDLSAWIWVQAGPMLAVALVLILFPTARRDAGWLGAALGCYLAAKIFELADSAVYAWTSGLLSGHPLKHLLAAGGVACLYMLVRSRSRSSEGPKGS